MQQFDTDKPRSRTKAYGVFLAGCVAIASLALVAVTQEPKKAVSSPGPAKASIVPQIADTKSASEILFRGKSFTVFKRQLVLPFSGEVAQIEVGEGQRVTKDQKLVQYKLDRGSMMQVHSILYPEMVLNLKRTVYDQKIALDKLNNASMPIKKLQQARTEKELSDLRQLQARNMASAEAVKIKSDQLETTKKEILEVLDTIKQTQEGLKKSQEDLRFYEDKQKRDLDLLEWQASRSYADSGVPMDVAFLTAPIEGQVIWVSPDLRVESELSKGAVAITMAPMNPIVVRCKVHELDLVKLKTGDKGTVTFDAIPETKYACRVNRIPWVSRNPALEVPADYDIECLLDNPDGKIKDGLTCNVKVSITQ
jgi:multidrug resistance efflux pump